MLIFYAVCCIFVINYAFFQKTRYDLDHPRIKSTIRNKACQAPIGVLMKRKLTILILVTILLLSSTFAVMAGGDKVRGDLGVGSVNQHQTMDPPPFQP
jgi:hypothetical protein